MRILHVVDSLHPGGMENGLVNVARRLLQQGLVTHVACLSDRGAFADRLPEASAVTLLGKNFGFSPAAIGRLTALIRDWSPDLVHTHNLGPLVYASFATLGGRMVPILHGEHGQIQPPEMTTRRILIRKALYSTCHTVHTVSSSLLHALQAGGFKASRMTAIANGVDCQRFRPPHSRAEARSVVDLPTDATCVLGIVGRFVALKRHRMLLESLEPVMAYNNTLHLLVVGDDGSERDSIVASMGSHRFANRIHWLGMRSDVEHCYQAMDLLVSPSEIEGLSNAVLEAMAVGVPVLANLACGNNEVIRDGIDGILRDLRDASSLADAIADAIAEPSKLALLGEGARQRVVESFSLDSMAEAYFRTYQSIIRDTGGAA